MPKHGKGSPTGVPRDVLVLSWSSVFSPLRMLPRSSFLTSRPMVTCPSWCSDSHSYFFRPVRPSTFLGSWVSWAPFAACSADGSVTSWHSTRKRSTRLPASRALRPSGCPLAQRLSCSILRDHPLKSQSPRSPSLQFSKFRSAQIFFPSLPEGEQGS